MKGDIKEVAYVFLSGFIIGIGCALVCMPPEKEELKEPLFELEAPANEEMDKDIRAFMTEMCDKYHLYKVKVSIEETPNDKE